MHAGIASLPKPLIGYYIACWDSFTSYACDWLCSHVWPCLIHAYSGVSHTFNLIITFAWGLAGDSGQSVQLVEIATSH